MSRSARLVTGLAMCALLLLLAGGAPFAHGESPAAAGGVRLIDAIESAPVTLVGEIVEPGKLDLQGWAAGLRIERVLVGGPQGEEAIGLAWEERAPSRPPRFADGDRVLVMLEALPDESIWLTRLPDAARRTQTLFVAERGSAFLRTPSLGGLGLLEHYLAIVPDQRRETPGVGLLARLAAGAEPALARSAVGKLAGIDALDAKLGPGGAVDLVTAFLRPDATPELQTEVLELIRTRRLESTRPRLVALAGEEPLVSPLVFAALAGLDGALTPEQTERLLDESPIEYRVVAARYASGAKAERRLERLLRNDPAPAVRSAAVERLVELAGEPAIGRALDALADPDPTVRRDAAFALARLGEPAVAHLQRVAEERADESAQAAVVALRQTGSPAAERVLFELAQSHPDPGIRALARLAVGGALEEPHH